MKIEEWSVELTGQAKKFRKNLSKSAADRFFVLIDELKERGPERFDWPNYSLIKKISFHCHIKKGRPTYVCCWQIKNKKEKIIEIYYAGTHEKAPY